MDEPRAVRTRALLFAAISAICLVLAGGYVARAARANRAAAARSANYATATLDEAAVSAVLSRPHVMFRSERRNGQSEPLEEFGRLAAAPLEAPERHVLTPLRCLRAYFAGGRGLCLDLAAVPGIAPHHEAVVFGADFRPRGSVPLAGIPSRARVSPDGKYGATTVFSAGHSYSDGQMSTQTTIIDMEKAEAIAELEQFTLWNGDTRYEAPDLNYWGVTFARESGRFYATAATAKKTWLVEGDVVSRKLRMLRENVECPSLSPDQKRIAFKKRVGGPGEWRASVLDLATLRDAPLWMEPRSVDDQLEWLDDDHLLYGHGGDVWLLPIEGRAGARVLLPGGSSPSVSRSPT